MSKYLKIVWGEDTLQENLRAQTLVTWFETFGVWCGGVEPRPGEGVFEDEGLDTDG